jgi:hypothetical protein
MGPSSNSNLLLTHSRFTFSSHEALTGVNGVPQKHDILTNRPLFGIENGREPEYYKALQQGALKSYAFDSAENAKPETAYFRARPQARIELLSLVAMGIPSLGKGTDKKLVFGCPRVLSAARVSEGAHVNSSIAKQHAQCGIHYGETIR